MAEDSRVTRPAEPVGDTPVWHLGWECVYSPDSEYWTGEGWYAYKGRNVPASILTAARFTDLLGLIEGEQQ